jgi:hypothetical protein
MCECYQLGCYFQVGTEIGKDAKRIRTVGSQVDMKGLLNRKLNYQVGKYLRKNFWPIWCAA